MGNTISCCCCPNHDCLDEGPNKETQSPQISVEVSQEGEVTVCTAPQTQNGSVETQDVFHENLNSQPVPTLIQNSQATFIMTKCQAASTGMENQAAFNNIQSQVTDSVTESQATAIMVEKQADAAIIRSQAVCLKAPMEASARGSAADSASQDELWASLGDLFGGQEIQRSKPGMVEIEVNCLATGIPDDRLSLESDDSEAWFTCEEDLSHSEEEIEKELEQSMTKARCSLEPPMAILDYSEWEWKGQSNKSMVMRKGYSVLSQSFRCLQRVKEDHYSALRATLYQALMSATTLPDWLQHERFLLIPKDLQRNPLCLVEGWVFPNPCKQTSEIEKAVDLMTHYLGLLQKWWQAAAASPGLEARRRVCEQLFRGGEDEFGLMEALKLLMISRAVKLDAAMQKGHDVPVFCPRLFVHDKSKYVCKRVIDQLSMVGFSGGLQVSGMLLLGYALCHTIKVYRLHMVDTEEFITHYPDDHIQDWPCVCLVTEDDHHYNIAVTEPTSPQEDLSGRPL